MMNEDGSCSHTSARRSRHKEVEDIIQIDFQYVPHVDPSECLHHVRRSTNVWAHGPLVPVAFRGFQWGGGRKHWWSCFSVQIQTNEDSSSRGQCGTAQWSSSMWGHPSTSRALSSWFVSRNWMIDGVSDPFSGANSGAMSGQTVTQRWRTWSRRKRILHPSPMPSSTRVVHPP